MTQVKVFEATPGIFEGLVNDWVMKTGALVKSVSIVPSDSDRREAVFLVLYEAVPRQPEHGVSDGSEERAVPTVVGYADIGGNTRSAQCMAGCFGVPEGWKLSANDGEPAPRTLLSPDCDLTVYAELFGNIRSEA